MDMRSAGPFKHAGNKYFRGPQDDSAYRADPVPVPVEAVYTTLYIHKPVLAPGKRRKNRRFDQFAFIQPGRTYRAGLGRSGVTFTHGLTPPPVMAAAAETYCRDLVSGTKKQGIPEPEEKNPGKYK
jgi:hypothetical protein